MFILLFSRPDSNQFGSFPEDNDCSAEGSDFGGDAELRRCGHRRGPPQLRVRRGHGRGGGRAALRARGAKLLHRDAVQVSSQLSLPQARPAGSVGWETPKSERCMSVVRLF